MGKSSEIVNKIKNGWQGLSGTKKMALGILLSAVIISLGIYYFVFGRTQYVPIFTNLNIQDSGEIINKLEEMKVSKYKIADSGRTVLVSAKDVDRLRLDLAIDGILPNEGKGFEIFDDAGFAITDEDRKIMYQRALEGELQRSIMSLKEVEFARVHLVLAEDTIFSKEIKPGSASVILKIKPLEELQQQQIKGIISLVSGAVKNLPEENVRVVDSEANLLSDGVMDDKDSFQSVDTTTKRIEIEKQFEKNLEKDLNNLLEQTLGVGKVLVKVAADLDFDSYESTAVTYDKDGAVRSQQIKTDRDETDETMIQESPIDNNTQNYITSQDLDSLIKDSSIQSIEGITNYEVGETRIHTLKAPGEVKKISTSIIYDGDLTPAQQVAIRNIIVAATGFDEARGDAISVEGIKFDTTYKDKIAEELDASEAEIAAKEQQRQKYYQYGAIGAGVLFILLLLIFGIRRFLSKGKQTTSTIDVKVEEPVYLKEVIKETIEQIAVGEDTKLEKSIKDFAEKHPDKVADLIKAWIIEDER